MLGMSQNLIPCSSSSETQAAGNGDFLLLKTSEQRVGRGRRYRPLLEMLRGFFFPWVGDEPDDYFCFVRFHISVDLDPQERRVCTDCSPVKTGISEIWVLPIKQKEWVVHQDGGRGIASNVGMAVEGFGWPHIDLCTFLACCPNWSLALWWKWVQPQK